MKTNHTDRGTTAVLAARPPVIGWEGLLVPYAAMARSSDGRAVDRPTGGARIRGLPVGLKWQRIATSGHDRALTSIANITRAFDGPGGIWGSGPIDIVDPDGAEFARKLDEGYVSSVSVDMADWTMVVLDVDGRRVEALADFELIAATVVNDAAYGQARIFPVRDPSLIVPNAQVLADRRRDAEAIMGFSATPTRVMAVGDGVVINLRGTGTVENAVTVATDLPWAPRDHRWNEADARARVAELCGGVGEIRPDCYGRAFLWRDPDADAGNVTAYSMPVADVIDGELRLVYGAVSAAAGRLNQLDVPAADRERIAARLRTLYRRAADELDGPPITIPEGLAEMADNAAATMAADESIPEALVDDDASEEERLAQRIADLVVARINTSAVDTDEADAEGVQVASVDGDDRLAERAEAAIVAMLTARMNARVA